MALTDNLVSYWELEDATDSHGSNDLTESGSPSYVSGKLGNCVDLESSSSQYLSITDASQSGLDLTGDHTISAWLSFETAPTSAQQAIINKWHGGTSSYIYRFDNNGSGVSRLEAFYDDGTSTENLNINFSSEPTLNTFYHFVITYDASASQVELFINNSSQGTATGTLTSIRDGTAPFGLGANPSTPSDYFDGKIDEVGIWSRILTTSEISDLYNSGNGLGYPFATDNALFFGGGF